MNEDLRHGAQAISTLNHLGSLCGVEGDVDLLEIERFIAQKALGRAAIAAEGGGVKKNARHA
jgi:hypothetical protein